jgi:fluoroacetyl-CoA thioesterase
MVPGFYERIIPLPELPEVLATAWLVALIEGTCADALRPFLQDDETSVGVSVAIDHIAPTPAGFDVTARVHLDTRDGRRVTFNAECVDNAEVVAKATHKRIIIDKARFADRVHAKQSGVATAGTNVRHSV